MQLVLLSYKSPLTIPETISLDLTKFSHHKTSIFFSVIWTLTSNIGEGISSLTSRPTSIQRVSATFGCVNFRCISDCGSFRSCGCGNFYTSCEGMSCHITGTTADVSSSTPAAICNGTTQGLYFSLHQSWVVHSLQYAPLHSSPPPSPASAAGVIGPGRGCIGVAEAALF